MRTNRGPGNTTPAPSFTEKRDPETITLPNGQTISVPVGRIALSCRRGTKVAHGLSLGLVPVLVDAEDLSSDQWRDLLSDPFVKAIQVA